LNYDSDLIMGSEDEDKLDRLNQIERETILAERHNKR
jgi:hypothetical protein